MTITLREAICSRLRNTSANPMGSSAELSQTGAWESALHTQVKHH